MFGEVRESADFELWEEHIPVVELFMRCIRQWRMAGEGFLGIDYLVVDWVCRLSGIEPTLALLDDFQIMEAAAAEILNERKPEKKKGGGKR